MEFNQSSIKSPDTSDDHQVSGHFRSYTCTFCKRGFSNAQALGGHMNIHRKDRAKLKEYSGDQSVVFGDITTEKTTPSDQLHTSVHDDSSRKELSEEFKSCSPKRPSREGGDGVGELRKLDLFVETPSVRNGVEESSHVSEHVEKRKQLSHGSSQVELDLELRLGFGTSS